MRALWAGLCGLLAAAAWPAAAVPIQSWEEGGARVLFLAAPELPMVDLRVVFAAGSAYDGERPGLAWLSNRMLGVAAGPWDADAFAERLDALGLRHVAGVDRDMAYVGLRSLSDPAHLGPAAALLRTVLSRPRLDPDDLAREKQRLRSQIEALREQPDAVASEALYRQLYGAHPYARPPWGEAEAIEALDAEALRGFLARHYVRANAVLVLVGDLDRRRAESLARSVLGALPRGTAAPPVPRASGACRPPREFVSMSTTQTHIAVGQMIGLAPDDPDRLALLVANHVLGGSGFASRILQTLREAHGLAYSAYSRLEPLAGGGAFFAAVETRNETAAKAAALLDETIARFVAEGPSEDEFRRAVANLTGGFALSIDSNAELAAQLAYIGFYRLPLDTLDTFVARVQALDRAQVHEALRRRLDPQRLCRVQAGGFWAVQPAP
ncbi:MAG: peptidase M16 [Gammaproteobacteria bacterium]|nr:MAG: peptidase M16 [Gammaproteobacteria bacterium]